MRVVIRTDAASHIGSGHVMRCLALGVALRERRAEVRFICREHDGHACDLIEETGFPVSRLPRVAADAEAGETSAYAGWLRTSRREDAAETLAAIGAMDAKPDWLVIDHYSIDCRWESELRGAVEKIMVIDDLADRPHDCDLLLDPNLSRQMQARYNDKVPDSCVMLLGPRFALLQPLYRQLRDSIQPRSGPIRRILVFFGGVDSANLTSRTVAALLQLNLADIEIDVILSAANRQVQHVSKLTEGHPNIRLHHGLPSLAPLMAEADVAVGAGGTTSWERLCLGLPTLVITLSENQRLLTEEMSRRGLVRWLGHRDEVDESALAIALGVVIAQGIDKAWSLRCLAAVDGQGASRACLAMLLSQTASLRARVADAGDEALLLILANDPVTRANAFSSAPIEEGTHRNWLRDRLGDVSGCRIYIVETIDGVILGQARFDRRDGVWEIDYALASPHRGRGLGRPLLEAALRALRSDAGGGSVRGQVKGRNVASRRVFESLGFVSRLSSVDAEYFVYERDI